MRLRIFFMLAAVLATPAWGALDLSGQSTIRAQLVGVTCSGQTPIAVVNLYVNQADQGRPGLVYVGMHDPSKTRGVLLTQSGFVEYGGEAMYPPYSIESGGLHDVAISVPAGLQGLEGWSLYVGYGALSAENEAKVQAAQQALANARALGKPTMALDPNHHRRSFIQYDMEHGGKYVSAMTWTAAQLNVCNPYNN